jgi:hypothetical protein
VARDIIREASATMVEARELVDALTVHVVKAEADRAAIEQVNIRLAREVLAAERQVGVLTEGLRWYAKRSTYPEEADKFITASEKNPWWYDLHWQLIMLVGGTSCLFLGLLVLNHFWGNN